MMIMFSSKKSIYIIAVFFCIAMVLMPFSDVLAQCTGPFRTDLIPNPCCPIFPVCGVTCPACVPVPLDGGLSALLIAGIAFGAKKVFGKA